MNNKEYILELSKQCGYTQADTQRMVSTIVNCISDTLCDGDSFQVPAFGVFEVKKRLERVIMNPATQQKMLVPPKLILNFRPTSEIKEVLKNKDK